MDPIDVTFVEVLDGTTVAGQLRSRVRRPRPTPSPKRKVRPPETPDGQALVRAALDRGRELASAESDARWSLALPDILDGLRMGLSRAAACARAGVDREGFARHVRLTPELESAIEKVEAEVEARITKQVIEAAEGDWKAGAWWLGKRRTRDWGDTASQELSQVVRIMAQQSGLTEEETKEAIRDADRMLREERGLPNRPIKGS